MEGVYRMQNINLGWKFQKLPGMDIRALSALPEINEAEAETAYFCILVRRTVFARSL